MMGKITTTLRELKLSSNFGKTSLEGLTRSHKNRKMRPVFRQHIYKMLLKYKTQNQWYSAPRRPYWKSFWEAVAEKMCAFLGQFTQI